MIRRSLTVQNVTDLLDQDAVNNLIKSATVNGLVTSTTVNSKVTSSTVNSKLTQAAVNEKVTAARVNELIEVGSLLVDAGEVGSYVFASTDSYSVNANFGDNVSGSSLSPTGIVRYNYDANGGSAFVKGSPLSGTWRCMGHTGNYDNWDNKATLWVRIV